MEELLRALRTHKAFFWRTHQGAELDLLLFHNGKRYGFEIKLAENPRLGRSAKIVIHDLQLAALRCIYPGDAVVPINDTITLRPFKLLYSHPMLYA